MTMTRDWRMALAALGIAGLLGLTMGGCATQSPAPRTDDRHPIGEPTAVPAGEEWIDLLALEQASAWTTLDAEEERFAIEDGVLHIPGVSGTKYIAYMGEEYGDFTLHVEFKVAPGANSGVMFRASEADPVYAGMEIQVYDSFEQRPHHYGCGALYDVATPMLNPSRPAGEWNSYDLTCKGGNIQLVFNGFLVLDVDTDKLTMPIGKFDTPYAELPEAGYLMVQDHGDEVWYRDMRIKKLD